MNHIRKITRIGRARSFSVVIPAEIMRALKWHEKQRVLVKKVPGGVLIRDAKTKKR